MSSVKILYLRSIEGGMVIHWIHPDTFPSICIFFRLYIRFPNIFEKIVTGIHFIPGISLMRGVSFPVSCVPTVVFLKVGFPELKRTVCLIRFILGIKPFGGVSL